MSHSLLFCSVQQVKKLQAILKPMMLRRLKDDVEKNLAPKEETIIEVELTNIQKKYYRAILEKNFSFLSKGANQHNMPNLINTMMELRKCCNHPYLITGERAHEQELQAMIQAAGKLVLIDKLLPKLLAGGHKVLVFSQMVRCLDILEDYLIQRRYTYERIDGRVRGNLRQAAIDRFCKPDSDRFVFLLCTRAGGLGINLTAADTCIIFDSDWNPQNDLQAQARCHRIGQSKAVKVYRLITRNSYEREMFDKASLKLGLDKAVLQDINRKGTLLSFPQRESPSGLRASFLTYGALMDEEDEGSKFCEEDIDQILQRRTQTITIQSEGKGSTFAKVETLTLLQKKYKMKKAPVNINQFFPLTTSVRFSFLRPASSPPGTELTFLWTTPTSGRNGPKSPRWRSTPSRRRYERREGGIYRRMQEKMERGKRGVPKKRDERQE
uniref:Helicase C-terminal domain-containing protein n=1 Tax=Stegastes partitus TaxID=144197 RepID=A0A3B5AB69_9TELE